MPTINQSSLSPDFVSSSGEMHRPSKARRENSGRYSIHGKALTRKEAQSLKQVSKETMDATTFQASTTTSSLSNRISSIQPQRESLSKEESTSSISSTDSQTPLLDVPSSTEKKSSNLTLLQRLSSKISAFYQKIFSSQQPIPFKVLNSENSKLPPSNDSLSLPSQKNTAPLTSPAVQQTNSVATSAVFTKDQLIFNELVTTEQTFLKGLDTLLQLKEHLKQQKPPLSARKEQILFGGIEELHKASSEIVATLSAKGKSLQPKEMQQLLNQVFSAEKVAHMSKHFAEQTNNQSAALKLSSSSPLKEKINEFLQSLKAESFFSLSIQPVQRGPRYTLLFADLEKNSTAELKSTAQNIKAEWQKGAEFNNEKKRDQDIQKEIQDMKIDPQSDQAKSMADFLKTGFPKLTNQEQKKIRPLLHSVLLQADTPQKLEKLNNHYKLQYDSSNEYTLVKQSNKEEIKEHTDIDKRTYQALQQTLQALKELEQNSPEKDQLQAFIKAQVQLFKAKGFEETESKAKVPRSFSMKLERLPDAEKGKINSLLQLVSNQAGTSQKLTSTHKLRQISPTEYALVPRSDKKMSQEEMKRSLQETAKTLEALPESSEKTTLKTFIKMYVDDLSKSNSKW